MTLARLAARTLMACVFVIPPLHGCGVKEVTELAATAEIDAAGNQLASLANHLDMWFARKREYPASLQVLVDERRVHAGQIVDPWSQPLIYSRETLKATVCSRGPDKKPETADDLCKSVGR